MDVYLSLKRGHHRDPGHYQDVLVGLGHVVRTVSTAEQRFVDVCRSNCLILLAPASNSCHVEFGMAIALNLRCIVVGPVENVFHSLPQVERYQSFEEMVARFLTEPENGYVQPSTVMRSYLDLL